MQNDDDTADRDPDLVTLEGLEADLGDLDAELAQAERSADAREAAPAAGTTAPALAGETDDG